MDLMNHVRGASRRDRSEGSEGRKEEEEKKKKVGNFQLGKGVKISNLKF
ncbi:hypothetical protein BMF77_02961 [Dolichospermum sp. UHCC 0315A]|nr:hypothetical protein BMF77_02961 [Dolichospermum sp. UHCC 0315A]